MEVTTISSDYQSRTKAMLRKYLNLALAASNTSRPKLHRPALSPHQAVIEHRDDLVQQAAEYEDILALHSGYATDTTSLSANQITKALSAMATTTFTALPTELQLMIFDFALPRHRRIWNGPNGKAVVCGRGENEANWDVRAIIPAPLRVNKTIRDGLLPAYLSSHYYIFHALQHPSTGSLLSIMQSRGARFFQDIHIQSHRATARTRFTLYATSKNTHLRMSIRGCHYVARAKPSTQNTDSASTIDMEAEVADVVELVKHVMGPRLTGDTFFHGYHESM